MKYPWLAIIPLCLLFALQSRTLAYSQSSNADTTLDSTQAVLASVPTPAVSSDPPVILSLHECKNGRQLVTEKKISRSLALNTNSIAVLQKQTPQLAPTVLANGNLNSSSSVTPIPPSVVSAPALSSKDSNGGLQVASISPAMVSQASTDSIAPQQTSGSLADASSAAASNSNNPPKLTQPGIPGDSRLTPIRIPKKIPTWQTATPYAPEGELRRGLPAPLDPVFPGTEWVGQPLIGAPDTDPVWKLESVIYKACPVLKRQRIKIYGWGNPGGGYSTSKNSNIPLSYAIVPNRLEMEQLILRIERTPDTVQTEHMDWGFRLTNLYGIDYRWTTAQSWQPASTELLNNNKLYGFDPVELYGQIYIPKVKQGMMVRFGRYISPPDIEAQLSPDNYLWTHSVMFTVDAYTHTGIQTSVKLSDRWMAQAGIHSGSDMAPWAPGAIPTAEAYLRYTTKSNNDSLYGGVDGINNGRFRLARETVAVQNMATALSTVTGQTVSAQKIPAHDNLQQFNLTWGHRFNRRLHTMTEAYFLFSKDALVGGTVNNGPPRAYNANTGPGGLLPGISQAWGFVNYTALKLTNKDYLCIRPLDILVDDKGWRTGYRTTYESWTAGWVHRFNDYLTLRPEIRYERSLSSVKPYDNGHAQSQFTLGLDLIQRF